MRIAHAVLFLACCLFAQSAQGENPQVAPKDQKDQKDAKDTKPVAKKEKELVPGYRTTKIEGFTFVVKEAVFTRDLTEYERKPLDVLEQECKTLVKILSPKALAALRGLVIFVEWDEEVPLHSGRKGNATATYYPMDAAQMVKDGKHALQAKTVTIHSLKALTAARQPKKDTGECLLLHEFAHAIHDQLLGFDHAGIKAAYQQAMERKLYDKDLYVATNDREFFAELSCAYLDRLRYYPNTRADLQKHDPTSFKVMETVWAGVAKKQDKTDTAKNDTRTDGSDKFNLALTLPDDIKFGKAVVGAVPTTEDMKGHVVVIGYWGGEFATVLNRLNKMNEDLAPYGLLAIASSPAAKEGEDLAVTAAARGHGFPILDLVYVKENDDGKYQTQKRGHALVFDHTGKCIFRGSAYDADKPVRVAIGRKLIDEACGAAPPADLKAVVEAFAAGTDPVAVYSKVTPLTKSSDETTKTAAKKLAEAILAPGSKTLADAQANTKTDPVTAFLAAEGVAARYKNTPLAEKAQTLTTSLRPDKAVANELKARTALAQLQKIEGFLRGQNGSFNPLDSKFQAMHQQSLAQMREILGQLKKQHPNAHATAEAQKIAREFGVE
jgi:hypothetical protein